MKNAQQILGSLHLRIPWSPTDTAGYAEYVVKIKTWAAIAALLLSLTMFADTLGFVEQKFSHLNFEKKKWSRTDNPPCYTYTANEDGATVDVLRYGMSNLVPFRATKGLRVIVCGSTAAFDEGFEASSPGLPKTRP